MPRSIGISVENNFTKGFLTEFSGLNFPENSCLDIENCILTETGEVYRRQPIDREYGYVMNSVSFDETLDVCNLYSWAGVGIGGNVSLVVAQIGTTIHFWQSNNSSSSISGSKKSFTVNLESMKVSGAPSTRGERCSFSSGNGKLFVAHAYCQPFYIQYNSSSDSITTSVLTISVRDFGIQSDDLATDNEPTTLSSAHKYNLINQGWTSSRITSYYSSNSKYPSKAQVAWFYRSTTDNKYDFDPANRSKYEFVGGSLAPRGYIVLDAFNQQKSTVSGVSGIASVTSGYYRPTAVAFMNSRVFYAGVKADGFSSTIYFSSIMKATTEDLLFYQKNDPTSEIANILLANDGGTIVIPEAETIIALAGTKSYLLVFASNGVWAIGGSEGIGFSATDYMVQRVSDVPVLNAQSVIVVDNTPVWWNYDGIYATSANLESLQVKNLTKDSIQSFYDTIPNNCKKEVAPTFNRLTSEIVWSYSSDEDSPKAHDSLLVLKSTTQAFYKHSFDTTLTNPIGICTVSRDSSGLSTEVIIDTEGGTVTTTLGAPVTINVEGAGDFASSSVFVLLKVESQVTFGTFRSGSHIDWITFGNTEPFDSYLKPAYRVRGDGIRNQQMNFIEVYSKSVTDGSCFVRGVWDYAASEAANKYSTYQQVVPARLYRDAVSRKLRIRGTGRTLNLEFVSDSYKPFHLIGWATQDIVNNGV